MRARIRLTIPTPTSNGASHLGIAMIIDKLKDRGNELYSRLPYSLTALMGSTAGIIPQIKPTAKAGSSERHTLGIAKNHL